ncbi:unnamed protein product [Leuciscus chuanchicus]
MERVVVQTEQETGKKGDDQNNVIGVDKKRFLGFIAMVVNCAVEIKGKSERIKMVLDAARRFLDIVDISGEELDDTLRKEFIPSQTIDQRQLFHRDGHHPNKLGSRVLKDNIYFSLNHPSAVCANPLNLNGTHTPGHSMNDHGTSLQQQNGHDNTTPPQQPLLTDTISAEPCTQSSPQIAISELLEDSAPKDDFLENSQGSQDSILQPPITPEQQPLSPDTLSLSPATPLLCFSQKMEELVHAGTRLSHSFAASPQIPTKKRQAPLPPKPAGPARPHPPPVRALRPLPQRQGPHPPPSARGEPKTTDTSSQ